MKFMIEEGKNFYIPIHDERYYKNPEKYDLERFSEENRVNIDPDTFIPVGVGPWNCIASRFALMEVKTVIFNFFD